MQLIEQSAKIEQALPENTMELLESAARTCYQSAKSFNCADRDNFLKKLIFKRHESVFEHVHASIRFVTSRSVTHELVRHRLCSFSQESTRYVSYKDGIQIIKPVWWGDLTEKEKKPYLLAWEQAEKSYQNLVLDGNMKQFAREVLPSAIKTEIVMTTNLREWKHIFNLRMAKGAHPQMIHLMHLTLGLFVQEEPLIFSYLKGA